MPRPEALRPRWFLHLAATGLLAGVGALAGFAAHAVVVAGVEAGSGLWPIVAVGAALSGLLVGTCWWLTRSTDDALARLQQVVARHAPQQAAPALLPGGRTPEPDEMVALIEQLADALAAREVRLAEVALRDPVTGLPNRIAARAALHRALRTPATPVSPVALLRIEAPALRALAASHGTAASELAARELARRLADVCGLDLWAPAGPHRLARELAGEPPYPATPGGGTRDAPTAEAAGAPQRLLARVGEGEFAVVLEAVDEQAAARLAHATERLLRVPFVHAGRAIDLRSAVALAVHPAHGDEADALWQASEIALAEARGADAGVVVFEPALLERRDREAMLLADLRRALQSGEIALMWLPIVPLRGAPRLRAEALLRWDHPELGEQRPSEFVGLALRSGLMPLVTDWVLAAALRQLDAWSAVGLDVEVVVNVSALELADASLAERIGAALMHCPVPADRLMLDVGESALLADSEPGRETMAVLDAMGVRFAIDDFGRGFESLEMLGRLPFDALKIDRALVHGIGADASRRSLVTSAIELGQRLGLEVIAEGVEDATTLQQLRELGCDAAQGFHIGRPVAGRTFELWVRHQAERFAIDQRPEAGARSSVATARSAVASPSRENGSRQGPLPQVTAPESR